MNAIEVLKGCLKQNNNKCVDLKELGNGEYQIIFTPEFLKILNEVCLALEKPYHFNKKELIKFLLAYDRYVGCRDYKEEILKMTAYAFLEDIGLTKNGKVIREVLQK